MDSQEERCDWDKAVELIGGRVTGCRIRSGMLFRTGYI